MKKYLIALLVLLAVIPNVTFGATYYLFPTATSTTQGWVSLPTLNGVAQLFRVSSIYASSTGTNATSTFHRSVGDLGGRVVFGDDPGLIPPSGYNALIVNFDGALNTFAVGAHGNNSTQATAGMNTFSSRGTSAVPTATQSGDPMLFLGARGFGATGYTGSKAVIQFVAAQNYTDANNGAYIEFEVTANNTTGRREQMRLDQNGFLGVGSSTPSAVLSVTGTTTAPAIYVSSTTPTVASSTLYAVDQGGWVHYGGGTGVLSSCGTSPSLGPNSTDQAGTMTFGATASGCTYTFASPAPTAPHCLVSTRAVSLANAYTVTVSATALTITQAASGGVSFDYFCPLGH